MAFGHDKSFVAAMVAIDLNTVGNWAERRGVSYTSYADLSQKRGGAGADPGRDRARATRRSPTATQVRRFLLLTKDLDADDAEMTRTRKVRRRFVAEKYADVIDAFYAGATEVDLTSTVTYEDGRQATVQARVRIEDVAGEPAHV